MSALLHLEDCEYKVSPPVAFPESQCLEIQMKLPKMLSLRGVPSERFHASDHFHWVNSAGSFFIDCTHHASFWPSRREGDAWVSQDVKNYSHHFESTSPWRSQEDLFRIYHLDSLFRTYRYRQDSARDEPFHEGMDKKEIITRIRNERELDRYLQAFFGWMRTFRETHGDERVFVVPEVYHDF